MKIGIGNDHAAVEMKMQIREYLESLGHCLLYTSDAADD